MKCPLLLPTCLSFNNLGFFLKKCMKAKALKQSKQIHASFLASGVDMNSESLNSKLVGLYASCGNLNPARLIFQEIQNPDVFALNWMISASAFNGYCEEAIGYFSLLQESKHHPNGYTFSTVLTACVGLMDANKGKKFHAMIYKMGFESNVGVGNALIDMYGKCGNIGHARRMFDGMPKRDVASWTSMICGFSNTGKIEQSLVLFHRMKLEGLEPNEFTWNAMIVAHARRGDCRGALTLFSRMTRELLVPDLVTWNALISGSAQSLQNDEAVKLFCEMLNAGIRPNPVTMTGFLPVCGSDGSLMIVKAIHGLIYRMGLYINVFVCSALIDMYLRRGSVIRARNVFDKTQMKNVASWNAMIGCYGKHGMVDLSIELFERMQDEGMKSNKITLVSVLSVCSHGGLVEKGLKIFRSMKDNCGIEISKEHYACVVDILCRSGRMEEAYELVKQMQMEVTNSIVGAFFNGCKIHKRRDLAKKLAEDILNMNLNMPEGFVTLSNFYAADGEWDEVENVRNLMKENGFHKGRGFSWVEKKAKSAELGL